MDPDVHSKTPGKCPRCGMTLEARIPAPVEYPMRVAINPPAIPAGQPLEIDFRIDDPKTGAPVRDFQIVHEKYFHLFAIRSDLEFFAHEHPVLGPDGVFRHHMTFPGPGHYKLIGDFYPTGGTPQLISKIVTTAGFSRSIEDSCTHPAIDIAPKKGTNLEVALTMEPMRPIAGKKTLLFFHVTPAGGLEPYLGAWAHMLIASADFIDADHTHPSIANGGPDMQFNLFFPREAIYRVWVQFQRMGQVNTVAFTILVTALR
ncbi:MAG: hypothetical protein M3Z23_01945 [Acidobacteriota bacterium]|nr:hypothetical protein [Acidobacteriota bacterium]